MKPTLLFLATATLAYSQTDTSRQLKESIEKHDAAVLAAVEPIHQRHVEELKGILAKATRAGDLDTAVKAKEHLAKYGVKLSATGEVKSTASSALDKFTAQVKGTAWALSNSQRSMKVMLDEDGTCRSSWHDKKQKWKVTGVGKIEAIYDHSRKWTEFTFDPAVSAGNSTYKKIAK